MTATVPSNRELGPALAGSFLVVAAAMLAAMAPLRLSIASVFLFAGPHNWMEARYFLSRMPVRWGRLRPFFLTAMAGVALLSVLYSAFPIDRSVWHTALVLWALVLMRLCGRGIEGPAPPIALLWMAFAWRAPHWADLSLVYLHPMAALWFLKRQVERSYPEWAYGFRVALGAIAALALGILVTGISRAEDPLLIEQASTFVTLPVSAPLVALHAFLELLHYGVWVLMLPAIGLASAPWRFSSIPLVRHRLGLPRLARTILIGGAFLVVVLWAAFTFDYNVTRNIYFSIAVVHVMAEIPFLMWLR